MVLIRVNSQKPGFGQRQQRRGPFMLMMLLVFGTDCGKPGSSLTETAEGPAIHLEEGVQSAQYRITACTRTEPLHTAFVVSARLRRTSPDGGLLPVEVTLTSPKTSQTESLDVTAEVQDVILEESILDHGGCSPGVTFGVETAGVGIQVDWTVEASARFEERPANDALDLAITPVPPP